MLATHNSATGYSISYPWWAKGPINWYSKCQSLTLEEQWDFGVRFFDFRVRKGYNKEDIVICHGIPEYDITLSQALSIIYEKQALQEELKTVYISIRWDHTFTDGSDKDAIIEAYNKYVLCYPTLRFISLHDDSTWEELVEGYSFPFLYESHSSVDNWKCIIPPYLWSKLYNKDEYTINADYINSSCKYLMLDFINIGYPC